MCNADGASARVIEVQTPATTPTLYTIGDSAVTLDRTAMWIIKHSDGNVIGNHCGVSIVALDTLEPFISVSPSAEMIFIHQTYDISYGDTVSPSNSGKNYSWTFAPSIDGVTITGSDYVLAAQVTDPCTQVSFTLDAG